MPHFSLTRAAWKSFKEENGLSKSSIFKKADVGPHIDSLQKAIATFEKHGEWKDFTAIVVKTGDLLKAFDKFIKLKEAKEELSDHARRQIDTWKNELVAVQGELNKLKGKEKEMKEKGAENMDNIINHMGLGGL